MKPRLYDHRRITHSRDRRYGQPEIVPKNAFASVRLILNNRENESDGVLVQKGKKTPGAQLQYL